jgi:hypothetical protein
MHTELSSLLVNMKPESQAAVAVVLRTVIWNWIETFTQEFVDVVLSSRRRLEGQPERVFDLLYQLIQQGNRRLLWPTLAIILAVSPERLASAEAAMNGTLKYGKKVCLPFHRINIPLSSFGLYSITTFWNNYNQH